jgi:SAM-dependent methyltransferase
VESDPVYEATHRAWNGIWRDCDAAREHETAEYARARANRTRYFSLLPEDGVLVEAGCGVGTELLALERLGRRAHGIDYAPSALGKLRRISPRASLASADIHRLPLRSGSLAAYLSFGVLEHFAFGPVPALLEAARALRPGGVLVLTVPAPNLIWRAVRLKRAVFGGREPAYFETAYGVGQISDAAASAGFEDIHAHPIDHGFTLWGCGRPFRGAGHYETSPLADMLGGVAARIAPRAMAFATLLTARKGVGG